MPSPAAQAAVEKLGHCRAWFLGVDGEALTCSSILHRCKQTFFLLARFHPAAAREGNRSRQHFEVGSVLSARADIFGFLHVNVLFLPYVPRYVPTVPTHCVSLLPRAVYVHLQAPYTAVHTTNPTGLGSQITWAPCLQYEFPSLWDTQRGFTFTVGQRCTDKSSTPKCLPCGELALFGQGSLGTWCFLRKEK